MKVFNSIVLLAAALFWCGVVAVLDSFAIPTVLKQARAVDFPTVPGVVTRSEITVTRTKDSTRHRSDIRYGYVVDGREFVGTRVRMGTLALGNGSRQAHADTAAYPVGKAVTVYYDPAAPAESLLQPGLLPEHVLIALFAAPHHLIGIWLLLSALRRLRPGRRVAAIRHLDDLRIAVRMPWMSPLSVGLLSLGILSIVAGFAAVLALPAPTLTSALLVWAVILGIAVSLGLRRALQLGAGHADLMIDAGAKTVRLPLGQGRKQLVTLPFEDVRGLELTTRTIRTTSESNGHRRTTESKQYSLALLTRNSPPHLLMKVGDGDELRAIAETLSGSLGWEFKESFSSQ